MLCVCFMTTNCAAPRTCGRQNRTRNITTRPSHHTTTTTTVTHISKPISSSSGVQREKRELFRIRKQGHNNSIRCVQARALAAPSSSHRARARRRRSTTISLGRARTWNTMAGSSRRQFRFQPRAVAVALLYTRRPHSSSSSIAQHSFCLDTRNINSPRALKDSHACTREIGAQVCVGVPRGV